MECWVNKVVFDEYGKVCYKDIHKINEFFPSLTENLRPPIP